MPPVNRAQQRAIVMRQLAMQQARGVPRRGVTISPVVAQAERGRAAREEQAQRRSAGTIEDRIAALLARKKELADAVLGAGEAALTELTDAELAELVELRGGLG